MNQPLAGSVNTLGRLKSLGGNVYRYASAAGNLYRIAGNNPGAWTSIQSGLSLSRCSMVSYTPPFSSLPYIYIADANLMLQDNGTGSPSRWGILWPQQPMYASYTSTTGQFGVDDVPVADNSAIYSYNNVTSHTLATPVSTTGTGNLINEQLNSLAVVSVTGIDAMAYVIVGDIGGVYVEAITDTTTTGTTGTIWFHSANPGGGAPQYTLPVTRNVIRFVTPSSGTSYFECNFNNHVLDFSPAVTSPTQLSIILRINVHDPSDLSDLKLLLSTGDQTFANGYSYDIPPAYLSTNAESIIIVPLSSLTSVGAPNIHSVQAFRLVTTQTGAATVDYYSLNLDLGNGPSILGGIPYQYMYTYFNANTGDESGPSPMMLPNGIYQPVSLFYGGLVLYWQAPTDPRVTHIRIYRLGGTLPNQYQMIAQVAATTVPPYIDNTPDSIAEVGNVLNIDNYPPITSTLPNPVNTTLSQAVTATLFAKSAVYPVSMANISVNQRVTLGTGATQETVTVAAIFSDHFTALLEFNHNLGETVYAEAAWAQPCNGAQVGFDRLFLFGDPNNPGNIYFSDVGYPSSFGVENFLTLDDTTDPVMGITPESFGRMYAFTLGGSVYQLVSVNGSIPVAVKTNATHGMFSLNAYMVMDQGIPYYSNDGIYFFNGGTATEVSQILQWIFRQYSEAGGPLPVQDLTQRNQVNFGFFWDEAFISYKAVDGNRYRVIFSPRDNRWRNDTIPASAQLYERDTATLIYGDDTGMVYQDRTGDQDFASPGTAVPVPYEITTASLDQGQPKNPKWYTELTVDINTNGQIVPIYLLLNNQDGQPQNVIGPFSVNTPVREQINFKINSGLGVSSLNVAFDIVGEATQNFDLFQLHLKALVDAETRQSFDTFWTKYGSEQWKVCKQGYFEYISIQDTIVGCYQGGNMTTPVFTFVLPSTSGNRNIIWIRFPSTKAKLWRFVGVSNFDFQVYPSSHIEVKVLGANKGYQPQPLTM